MQENLTRTVRSPETLGKARRRQPRPMLLSVLEWRRAERCLVSPTEVLRTFEPARERHIEYASLGVKHKLSSPIEAHTHRVRRRALAERLRKQASELSRCRSCHAGEVRHGQGVGQVLSHQIDRGAESGILDVGGSVQHTALAQGRSTETLMVKVASDPVGELFATSLSNERDRHIERRRRTRTGHMPFMSHIHCIGDDDSRKPVAECIEHVIVASCLLPVEHTRSSEHERPRVDPTQALSACRTIPEPGQDVGRAMPLGEPACAHDREISSACIIHGPVRLHPHAVARHH